MHTLGYGVVPLKLLLERFDKMRGSEGMLCGTLGIPFYDRPRRKYHGKHSKRMLTLNLPLAIEMLRLVRVRCLQSTDLAGPPVIYPWKVEATRLEACTHISLQWRTYGYDELLSRLSLGLFFFGRRPRNTPLNRNSLSVPLAILGGWDQYSEQMISCS